MVLAMKYTTEILPLLIAAIVQTIEDNAQEVTVLDQVCGDGDHVINLQRGLDALVKLDEALPALEWKPAMQKVGMIVLSTMGGASGSLFGTLFISMSKSIPSEEVLDQRAFSEAFFQGVEAVKKRGKAEAGEKTMLDVLIPVADAWQQAVKAESDFVVTLNTIGHVAEKGMESTKDMLATKGRASYLGEKTLGHIDAGARTSQLMICTIVEQLKLMGE